MHTRGIESYDGGTICREIDIRLTLNSFIANDFAQREISSVRCATRVNVGERTDLTTQYVNDIGEETRLIAAK